MATRQTQATQIAVIASNIQDIKDDISDIKKKLENNYVTKDQHVLTEDRVNRLEKIVYGVITIILIAFVGAVVAFFIPGSR